MKARFEQRYFPITFKSIASFLLLWLFTGFTLGTILLLGPVRKIAEVLEGSPSQELQERVYVILIILFLVVSTFWASLILTRIVVRSRKILPKVLIFTIVLGLGFGAYLLWINPRTLSSFMGEEEIISAKFTFGPYPTAERMEQLKSEGYTGIVSLLHPAVIPFEPKLIADERKAAAEVGIEFIHVPMLPWVSGNENAMGRIREIAQSSSGRYYVHCYLGEDRVQLFRRFVEKLPQVEADDIKPARRLAGREMARGRVVELEEGVYVTPFPVPQEFEGLIIFSNVKNVVAILDPTDEGDANRIDEEREILQKAGVPYTVIPMGSRSYNPQEILDAVAAVKQLARPVVVHSFHSVASGKAPLSEAFVQAYQTSRLPLPPSLFNDRMTNGQPRVVAPGVAVGPQPTGPEFGSYLRRRGIRAALHVGTVGDVDRIERDRMAAAEGRLLWIGLDGDPRWWIDLVRGQGPVYLYGPGSAEAAAVLAAELGPPVPGVEPATAEPEPSPSESVTSGE